MNEETLCTASHRHPSGTRPFARAFTALGALLLGSCDGGPSPDGPPSPTPGGTVVGNYLLEILPGASCNSQPATTLPRGPYSFPMVASAGGTTPHPGVQVVIEGVASSLELEFKYTDFTLRGGLGTTGEGVLTNQGLRIWIRAIGTGAVTQTANGRGQVTSGTLIGRLGLGGASDPEGALGDCTAVDHTFTLKVR